MCRQLTRCKSAMTTAPVPRKAWEESDSESDDSGSEHDAGLNDSPDRFSPSAPRPWSGAPKQLPSLAGVAKPVSSQALRLKPRPSPLKEEHLAAAPVPPRSAAPRGQAALACYLRRENNRLRQLLVQAQRQAEAAASAQPQRKSVADLSHLLELARDFGECPGPAKAWEEQPTDVPEAEVGETCMAPPQTARRKLTMAAQASELRAQLEASRKDVAGLRASLASRDAKLAAARESAAKREKEQNDAAAASLMAVSAPKRPSGSFPQAGSFIRASKSQLRSHGLQQDFLSCKGKAVAEAKAADVVKVADRPRSGSVSKLVARFEEKQRQAFSSCKITPPGERPRSGSQSTLVVRDQFQQTSCSKGTARNVQLPSGAPPPRRPIRRNCSSPVLVVAS